jgi:hypothetical protein
MRNLFVLGAGIAILLVGVAGDAQSQGITMDMINTILALEGAPSAELGSYEVASERAFGSPGHVLFRPADLSAFPVQDTLPVLV